MVDAIIHKTHGENKLNKKTIQYVVDAIIHKTHGENKLNKKPILYVVDAIIHKTHGRRQRKQKNTTQYVLDTTMRKQPQIM